MTTLETLLDIHVHGTPRPKGSMRPIGKGRMIEQLEGSPDWRRAVVDAAYKAIRCVCGDDACSNLSPGYPHTGPVEVSIALRFERPKSAPKTRDILPATRKTGDSDKQARNILDALQDAGVIKDDAGCVDLHVAKRYCSQGQAPGARIVVRTVTP